MLRALLSLLYLLTVAVQPLNNYIFYLVLALPNTRTMGLFDVSVALGVVVLYVFKKGLQYKNLSVNNKFICLLVCYLIYSLQYLIRFSSITYGIIMPIKDVVVFLFLYQICLKVNERDSYVSYQFLNKVVIYWFIGIIVALIPSMVISENITRYRVLNNDANILSVELVFLISVLSVLYIEANAITFKKYIILSSACFILCFATGSRTGLLLLAIVIALTIINSMASISKLLKVLFIILIGLFLFMRLDIIKTFINNLEVRNAILENKGIYLMDDFICGNPI